jgi:hypothetical protein
MNVAVMGAGRVGLVAPGGLATALETNYSQCLDVLGKLKSVLGSLEGRTICFWA